MTDSMTLRNTNIDVIADVDVVVCGGGSAGFAAATSAARLGASVLLVEQLGCLGGLGTAGLVPCFCPYSDGEKPVARGIGEEVLVELARRMRVELKYDWFNIHAETLKSVYDDILADSGAALRFFTKIVDVITSDGRIEAIVIATHEGLKAVSGKVFVETTGDGDVAAWAGAPFEAGDEKGAMQAATLCNVFANIDWGKFWSKKEPGVWRPDQALWRSQYAEGKTPLADGSLAAGVLPCGETIGGSNAGHVYEVNGLDEASLTRAIAEGRRQSFILLDWYRKFVPGFENAELAETGALIGVRETRRIMGDFVLTYEDYQARRSFDDEIGRYSYPIDVHESTASAREHKDAAERFMKTGYDKGESYGVPYRCLTARGLENVLTAGRCISADRAMQGSMRVMPGCFITGQAAGAAASLAAKDASGAVRDVDVAKLRDALKKQGAYIP